MAGTIVTDRIESDATYDSKIEIASPVVISNTFTIPAGTVGAPALSPAGDTNTGIYFPAADAIGISTNGADRIRVTSTGNVGIGTNSPGGRLDVAGGFARFQSSAGYVSFGDNGYIRTDSSGFLQLQSGSSGTRFMNNTNDITYMDIDSTGLTKHYVGTYGFPIVARLVGGNNTTWFNVYPFAGAYNKFYLSTHENGFEQFWEVSVGFQGTVAAIKTPDTGHQHSGDFTFRLSGGQLQCKNVSFSTVRNLFLYRVERAD
jgi:hypothetical protein